MVYILMHAHTNKHYIQTQYTQYTEKGDKMPVIKVTDDIHKRIMDGRNAEQVTASDVIRALFDMVDSAQETGVKTI